MIVPLLLFWSTKTSLPKTWKSLKVLAMWGWFLKRRSPSFQWRHIAVVRSHPDRTPLNLLKSPLKPPFVQMFPYFSLVFPWIFFHRLPFPRHRKMASSSVPRTASRTSRVTCPGRKHHVLTPWKAGYNMLQHVATPCRMTGMSRVIFVLVAIRGW